MIHLCLFVNDTFTSFLVLKLYNYCRWNVIYVHVHALSMYYFDVCLRGRLLVILTLCKKKGHHPNDKSSDKFKSVFALMLKRTLQIRERKKRKTYIKLFTTYSSVQKWYKGTEHMGAVFKLFGLSLHSFLTYKWLKYMFLLCSNQNSSIWTSRVPIFAILMKCLNGLRSDCPLFTMQDRNY